MIARMSAYLLMAVGLVSRKLAERAVYFELILILLVASLAPAITFTGRAAPACGCRWAACSHSSKSCRWCC